MVYNTSKIVVVIPARGGSKGIPRKNLYEIEGKPLIQYVLDATKESNYVDTVIVSTDCEEIASYSQKEGAYVPYLRDRRISTDTAKTIWAVHDAVSHAITQSCYTIVITLQPTQPLIQGWHIDEALELFIKKQHSVVGISACETPPILLRKKNDEGILTPLYAQKTSTVRRQDMEEVYIVNGMIYINSVEEIIQNKNLSLNDNTLGYFIDTIYSVDIDTPHDIELCRLKMKNIRDSTLI